jgi:hypothetical protein
MFPLTLSGVVTCDHKVGIVGLVAAQHFVRISGSPVLCGADPVGRPIAGCPNVGPTIKPCIVTLAVTAGHSGFVTIEDRPVCLDTLAGLTDGTPPGMVEYKVVQPGQSLVQVMG